MQLSGLAVLEQPFIFGAQAGVGILIFHGLYLEMKLKWNVLYLIK